MFIAPPRPIQKEFVKETYAAIPKKTAVILFVSVVVIFFFQKYIATQIIELYVEASAPLPLYFVVLHQITPLLWSIPITSAAYLYFFHKPDLSYLEGFLKKYKAKEIIPGRELPRPHFEQVMIMLNVAFLLIICVLLMMPVYEIAKFI